MGRKYWGSYFRLKSKLENFVSYLESFLVAVSRKILLLGDIYIIKKVVRGEQFYTGRYLWSNVFVSQLQVNVLFQLVVSVFGVFQGNKRKRLTWNRLKEGITNIFSKNWKLRSDLSEKTRKNGCLHIEKLKVLKVPFEVSSSYNQELGTLL